MQSFKYILFFLLLINLGVHAQKDSVKWHFGAKINYSAVIYPERKPIMSYKYSKSYGASLFFEKIFKKHPKLSLEGSFSFEIFNLKQSLPVLDTANEKYDPNTNTIIYEKYNVATFKYYCYGLGFVLNKKFSPRYTFGLGLKGIFYDLKETKGYSPFTFETGRTCTPSCRYYYYTLDYYLGGGFNVLPYLSLKNKFKLFDRNFLSLDLDISTLGFNYYYNANKWGKHNGPIYAGVNSAAINYLTFNYIFYFR